MGDLTDMTNEREVHEDEDEDEDETIKQLISTIELLVATTKTESYLEGYKTALRLYAWWKDGTQYVGCGAHTLKEVLDGLEKGGA